MHLAGVEPDGTRLGLDQQAATLVYAGADARTTGLPRRLPEQGIALDSFAFAPAPFSTPYTVTLSVQDRSFDTLASRSASITTKKPQQGSL